MQNHNNIEDEQPNDSLVLRDDKGRMLPGSVLNPYGRPKRGKSYRELAANVSEQRKQAVIDAQLTKAVKGADTRAAEFLRDTAEGKPRQSLDLTSPGDEWRMDILAALQAGGMAQVVEGEYHEVLDEGTSG